MKSVFSVQDNQAQKYRSEAAPVVAASCGPHYPKVTQNGAPDQRGAYPSIMLCASIQLIGDTLSVDHWSAPLSQFSQRVYRIVRRKSILTSACHISFLALFFTFSCRCGRIVTEEIFSNAAAMKRPPPKKGRIFVETHHPFGF